MLFKNTHIDILKGIGVTFNLFYLKAKRNPQFLTQGLVEGKEVLPQLGFIQKLYFLFTVTIYLRLLITLSQKIYSKRNLQRIPPEENILTITKLFFSNYLETSTGNLVKPSQRLSVSQCI